MSTEAVAGFVNRHIGPSDAEVSKMLAHLGHSTLDALIDATVPKHIRIKRPLQLPQEQSEYDAVRYLSEIMSKNRIYRSYIGMGYSDCLTPPVIQRNILENPGWYTQYTPYQAEIAQGRLEALLNFQTMIIDLTGLEIANASLLDEATAAAEAMAMAAAINPNDDQKKSFFVADNCHPQVIDVVRTRAHWMNIPVIIAPYESFKFDVPIFASLVQYPATDGTINNYRDFIERTHAAGALVIMSADLLSLTTIQPPGELGADIAIGSTQRFGVPMGFGGPHAAYISTKDMYKRQLPGRIIGASKDNEGRTALRLALQTREQHIRRDKATSNICTAQVLLAIMASMYAVYHGPKGLRAIADRIHSLASLLGAGLRRLNYDIGDKLFFDTIRINLTSADPLAQELADRARAKQMNLRVLDGKTITIALDEKTTSADIKELLTVFASGRRFDFTIEELAKNSFEYSLTSIERKSKYLQHNVFNSYHSETEFLRYITRLQSRDLSLANSMIPLGSCTMKLNATSEMLPVSWPEVNGIHPFVPAEQAEGYRLMIDQLHTWLAEITGFSAISFQPNAGSQGEYAGLLVIRKYLESTGGAHRDVCLIPRSAHGTNPASAIMAGLKVIVVDCDQSGNIDLPDLRSKIEDNKNHLAALMITYPSTHGVYEETVSEICELIHAAGGQVYMDGANMNAQVGLCRPGDFGADVCHLNLHKTFCIPHGGGGPGMGPIGVKSHLAPFLPSHAVVNLGMKNGIGAISSAPWGSPSILTISWAYIAMMGTRGLTKATQVAILSANYIAARLNPHFPVLYKGKNGLVAHECIIDVRQLKSTSGVEAQDVAKRLMDYGFHAPTVSFPVSGTLMIEPTESEALHELDRFCDAMISIREEIRNVEQKKWPADNNPVKNAPHTATAVTADSWDRPYSRSVAAFPSKHQLTYKFWPAVGRINEVQGDRQLICSCPATDDYT